MNDWKARQLALQEERIDILSKTVQDLRRELDDARAKQVRLAQMLQEAIDALGEGISVQDITLMMRRWREALR